MVDRSKLFASDGSLFEPDAYEVMLRPLAEDDGGWLATIADLPGCTGDGSTEIEALADVRLAALEWPDAAVADGKVIPSPSHARWVAAE